MRFGQIWSNGHGTRYWVSYDGVDLLAALAARAVFWLFIGWWLWLSIQLILLVASLLVYTGYVAHNSGHVTVTLLRLRWGLTAFGTEGRR